MPLLFEPEAHAYYLEGRRLPSVSQLLSPLGEEIPQELEGTVEAAAERGTALHRVMELLLTGGDPEGEYPEAYGAYVRGIRLFLGEHEIEPVAVERPMASAELGYAGTPDLVGFFDGQLSILDYKFVSQLAKTRVKAQLNAYERLYREAGVEIGRLYAVQFLPETYRLYPVAMDGGEFELCLALWRAKKKRHPKGRIE